MPSAPMAVSDGLVRLMDVSPPLMLYSPARAVISSALALGAVSPDHCSRVTGLSLGARRLLMYWLEPTISRSRSMV